MVQKHDVQMNWVAIKEEFQVPIFYDGHIEPVDEFHDYIVELAEAKLTEKCSRQAYRSTVEAASYALKGFLQYLSNIDQDWRNADKHLIEGYRDWQLSQVLASQSSKGNEKTAKRTVNVKLRILYHFYAWAQCKAKLIKDRLGPTDNYPIPTTLVLSRKYNGPGIDYISELDKERSEYPLHFPRVGEGSRAMGQYMATPRDKNNLIGYFTENCSLGVAKRNILIMELADQVGWRSGSINYLTTDQFSWTVINKAIEEGRDHILVKPDIQKFGYDDTFEVPIGLATRIARFIHDDNDPANRKAALKAHGWDEQRAEGRLWINMNDDPENGGKPLGDKRLTQIFSAAFKAIGAPSGMDAGLHSFRRKFFVEKTAEEIQIRRQKNLSTAVEDVLQAIALKGGQKSIWSQEPYQRAIRDDVRQSIIAEQVERIHELESKLAEIELENARLRRMLEQGQ